jgi:hypothetical protein
VPVSTLKIATITHCHSHVSYFYRERLVLPALRYITNDAVSMTSPPRPSIPEHHSSQFAVVLNGAPWTSYGSTASPQYCWPSSSLTSSPLADNPKSVRAQGSLSISIFHINSSPASHSCFFAGSGAKIRSLCNSHRVAGSKYTSLLTT